MSTAAVQPHLKLGHTLLESGTVPYPGQPSNSARLEVIEVLQVGYNSYSTTLQYRCRLDYIKTMDHLRRHIGIYIALHDAEMQLISIMFDWFTTKRSRNAFSEEKQIPYCDTTVALLSYSLCVME
jgi:hypothetical protein